MLDSRIARSRDRSRSASYGSRPPVTTSRGAVQDGLRHQLAARVALVQHDVGQPRDVQDAQRDHGQADDGRHADDLLGLDASASSAISDRESTLSLFRRLPRPRSLFNLLCSVFRLMPRISAARVLLSRVCSSVIRISRVSASSTVVPGVSDSVGFTTSGESVTSGGRCFWLDELARAEDHRALDHVAQLAHVARPVVLLEDPHRRRIERRHRLVVARVELGEERLHQQRQVLLALAQRRQLDGEHVQPVVQVLAQLAAAAPRRRD